MENINAELTSKTMDSMSANAFDLYIKNNKLADKSLIAFLKDSNYATKDLANYQEYLKKAGNGTSTFSDSTKKAGTALKSLAASLGSMAVMWAIGEAIGFVATKLSDIANESETARENANALATSMKEASQKSSESAQTVSNLNGRYQELSKGINSLGENVSLTSTEYDEYKSIVSQLSNAMPDLTVRFNEQGEKIGFVTSQLKDANKEFEKYQQRQALKYLNEGEDGKTVGDMIDDYNKSRSGKSIWGQTLDNVTTKWNPFVKVDTPEEYEKLNSYQDILNELQFWNSFETSKDFVDFFNPTNSPDGYKQLQETYNAMEALTGMASNDIYNDFDGFKEKVSSSIETYKGKLQTSLDNIKLGLSYMTQSQDTFYELSDSSKTVFNSIISGLNDESLFSYGIADEQGNVSQNDMQNFVNNLLKTFQNESDKIQPYLDGLLKINPVDLDDLSIPKAKETVDSYISELSKILHMNEADLKTSLSFDSLNTLSDDYEKTIVTSTKKFGDTNQEDLEKFFKKNSINTTEEIDSWNKIRENVSSAKEAKEQYLSIENSPEILDNYLDAVDKINNPKITLDSAEYVNALKEVETAAKAVGMSVNEWITNQTNKNADAIQNKLTNMVSAQDILNTALSEQNSTGTISATTLETLRSKYDGIDKVLQTTTNGIIINTTALAELNKEQQEDISSDIEKNQEALEQQYRNNSLQIAAYSNRLKDKNELSDEEIQIIENSRSTLEAQQTEIKNQVDNLEALGLQYENLVSKHNNFVNALNSADAGAGYDAIVSGIDKVKEAYENGDFGKDEIRAFVDYFTDKDMSTASISKLIDEYPKAMEKAEKYFTEDSTGSSSFLDLLKNNDFAEVDESGNWSINIEDFEEATEKTGLSVAAIQDSLMKLKDKGFEINFPIDETNLVDAQTTLDSLDERIAKLREKKLKIEKSEIEGDVEEVQNEIDTLVNQKHEIEIQITAVANEQQEKEDAINRIKEYYSMSLSNIGSDAVSSLYQQMQQIADENGLDLNIVLKTFTNSEDGTDSTGQIQEKVDSLNLSTDIAIVAQTEEFNKTIDAIKATPYKANVELNITNPNAIENIIANYINNNPSKDSDDGNNNPSPSKTDDFWTGSAYAHGKWTVGSKSKRISASGHGKSLVGELGTELLVRNGEYRTIGKNGAELMDIRKDDIIFNHIQTKHLLENGNINSRGKAYAHGKAYAGGNPPKDSSKQLINWIERRIKNLQTQFDRWKNQAENSATKFIDKYFKKATTNSKKLMNTEATAYSKYMSKANSVGLSSSLKKKVQNGKIKGSYKSLLKEYGEETADKISKYQDYYDKAQSALDSFVDTAEELYNLPLDKASVKIEKFNNAIDLLDKKLDNAIGSTAKNKIINKETKKQESILDANKQAKKETKKSVKSTGKALTKSNILNSSDVSKKERGKIKKAVKKGKEVNLTYFKEGSKAYKAAVKYNESIRANKKASNEAAKAQEDYNRWLVESAKIKFDNIADDYEKQIQVLGYDTSKYDNKISEIEASGAKVNRSYYDNKSKVNNEIKTQYQDELAKLEKQKKSIKYGTDEYYDALDAIQACKDKISECTKTTYELNNAINQLNLDLFDDIAEQISRITSEQEFLQGLFSHEKMTDDKTGNLTEAGIAKLGTLSTSYYASKEKANNDLELLKELQNVKAKGKQADGTYKLGKWQFNSLDDLEKQIDETYTTWKNDIKETYDYESQIADLMKEKYQAELDLLKKLIDDKKDALQAEKDLHDYQRSITEKTKDISTIQKQMAAYSGDTSQEGLAKLQKLQKELSEKEDALRETEYERYISDQEDMLDKLYEEYDELVTKKLDDFMELVQSGLDTANDNTSLISSYIQGIAKANGYTMEYNNVTGDGSVKKTVDEIEKDKTSRSGTTTDKSVPEPSAVSDSNKDKKHQQLNDQKALIEKVFGNSKYYKKGEKKKASDYKTSINQFLFKNNGKVLTSDGLKQIRSILGLSSNSKILEKLQNISKSCGNIKNVGGFKHGGIAQLVRSQGEDGITLARNGEGFIAPEHVPVIQNLLDSVPIINSLTESLIKPSMPNFNPMNCGVNNIDATYNFTLENCNNAEDMIHQIQTSPKIQKAIQSVSVDRIAGGGRLNVKNIR